MIIEKKEDLQLDTDKTFIWASKIMRKMAMDFTWIS